VNPPLRGQYDIAALVGGLKEGVIDFIATDHAPHTVADKACGFETAAFGISGFETALGSVMGLVHQGEIELATLVSRLTRGPASFLNRPDLGTLRPGTPADIVLLDPEAEWTVDPDAFASKGRNTPLAGRVLRGRVMMTVAGGRVAYGDNAVPLERR
jgi:dihydroorotase